MRTIIIINIMSHTRIMMLIINHNNVIFKYSYYQEKISMTLSVMMV